MYNHAEITESIIAGSNKAMEVMLESTQYELVQTTMSTSFRTLYDGKAFVLGVSQGWHNGTLAVTMTHGNYIVGNSTYTFGAGGSGYDPTGSGIGLRVNKFATNVQQKNSYGNGSSCRAAIFKID